MPDIAPSDVLRGPRRDPVTVEPLTVGELTRGIKELLEGHPPFREIVVLGEISNFRHHLGKHMYFSLKDETASVRCVCFENVNRGLAFKPHDGMEVVATGRLGVYPPTGNYQLYVRNLREAGLGALHRDFERLKRKLMTEGLTAPERKRALPAFPRRIGVVFSEESAGFRDILNVLGRRFPLAIVVLEPVAVEGATAAPSIVAGLKRMAAHGRVDLVIVGRGGGSIESLWAFNTEPVARAIAAMPVPVISAVGHETDVTIADLIADRRAATPTEAAELATPSIETIRGGLMALRSALIDNAGRRTRLLKERLGLVSRTLRSPDRLVDLRAERCDRLRGDLDRALAQHITRRERHLAGLAGRLATRSPWRRTLEQAALAERAGVRLRYVLARLLERCERRVALAGARLGGADPTAIMERGYAVVMQDGRALKCAADAVIGGRVEVRLHRGTLGCEVKDVRK